LTISEYKSQISGKTAAVVGVGVSNVPLIKFLLSCGANVCGYDKRSKDEIEEYNELITLGAKFYLGENYFEQLTSHIQAGEYDIIFKTPGIRPDIPPLLIARERGIEITSEMELFLKLCPAPIIGITGSDGKTTTTSLAYEILKADDKKVFLGGNIGTPLIAQVSEITSNDIVALEMSSFQLYSMEQSPDIGVITNITPNHLDWHTDMTEYINAKKSICGLNSERTKTVVLNADNDITREISMEVARLKDVILFSKELISNGVCIENGAIVWRENNVTVEKILETSDIKLPGVHNIENYMAAIAATHGLVANESVQKVAKEFGGVAHRIEFVRELDGVRYYNDSIATTPARAKAGLSCFPQKIIIIAGGYDKKIPFDEFGTVINERAKTLVLIGVTAGKIEDAVKSAANYNGEVDIIHATTLEDAVEKARDAAINAQNLSNAGSADLLDGLQKEIYKDIVILSPACASFDMFKNFEERGNNFKKIVGELN